MRGVLAVFLPGLVVAGLAPANAQPPAPEQPTLVGIRATHSGDVDRIVFRFDGGLPEATRVRYVDKLFADGSGRRVRVPGRAILRVRFEGAQAHDAQGATVSLRKAYALPNIITTVRAGDFEGVTTYGIGVAKRARFEVTTRQDPARVVIRIRAAFPTVAKKVWFFDEDNFVDNVEPFFRPVLRPVRPGTPATGVLDRLFAGPLPSERAAGLRLLRSRATGFADLVVDDGVATVRLTGGCSSNGSTVTIAGEIMPTLRQFPTVDWVKILDPDGNTEAPTGDTDSIPACLEP